MSDTSPEMKELHSIADDIEAILVSSKDPARILALLKKRTDLAQKHAATNPEMVRELISQNKRWINRSQTILADLKKKIMAVSADKRRRKSLQSAYSGFSVAHRIFSGRG